MPTRDAIERRGAPELHTWHHGELNRGECRGRGSNPHDLFRSQDFKSCASASFATPASYSRSNAISVGLTLVENGLVQNQRYRVLYVDIAGDWHETDFKVLEDAFESQVAQSKIEGGNHGGFENDPRSRPGIEPPLGHGANRGDKRQRASARPAQQSSFGTSWRRCDGVVRRVARAFVVFLVFEMLASRYRGRSCGLHCG